MARRALQVRLVGVAAAAVVLMTTVLLKAQQPTQQGQQQGQVPPPRPPLSAQTHLEIGNPRAPRLLTGAPMPAPAENPITEAKTALGEKLFFDRVLSKDRSVSCSTCHEPEHAFADTRPLAVGIFGRVGKRHSPALINRGFGRIHFWDGRAATLEQQVLMPIQDPNEMDLTLDEAVSRLAADRSYVTAFQDVFGGPPAADGLSRALATFLRSIRSDSSAYDKFVGGDTTALTDEQKLGLNLFRGKGRCIICHAEPFFTDESFRNTGIAWRVDPILGVGALQDEGRAAISGVGPDRGAFKTPTLREVANSAPYMHDGSLPTLDDVVNFYDGGGRPNPTLFPLVRPIGFTPDEKKAVVAFLRSLSSSSIRK